MEPLIYTDFLRFWAEQTPDADAILAPGKQPLSYGDLWKTVDHVVQTLRAMGIERNDRVATLMPKSPEAAVLYLGVAGCATCVPLNLASREAEIEYALSTLSVKCLVVQAGSEEPGAGVARALGIKIAVLRPSTDGRAGVFDLRGEAVRKPACIDYAEPDDFGLILQTSGTTSRSKMVPHTHRAMTAGVAPALEQLGITRESRFLNALPLFHLYGLYSSLAGPLMKGGAVVCTYGFDAHQFFGWLDEFRPTWFAGVPRMYQAIVEAAPAHQDSLARHTLRFLRSAASPLHPKLLAELEGIFRVPVLELYGLSEVGAQVFTNTLGDGAGKPGSVGKVARHEVQLVDESGQPVADGRPGEIIVRGPCVMQGYLGDPGATAAVLRDGWLHTGDIAYRDAEGYYFITGRIKELINRGGEKVSPREVDDVLMEHPAVKLAVAFAVPHPALGEDVAAAVVLAEGATVTSRELRAFAAARLAQHKLPRRVLIVDDIPKGPTGKPLRIGLAAKLAVHTTDSVYLAPRTSLETVLATIWTEVLGIERIGVHDDFFEIGGDSLLVVQMLDRVEATTGRKLPVETMLAAATIEHLAKAFLARDAAEAQRLVAVQPKGSAPPLFLMHGDLLAGGVYTIQVSRHLGLEQPLYVLNPHGTDERDLLPSIPQMAVDNVAKMMEVDPAGPYYLLGFCNGALVAFEMAQRLRHLGKDVAMLAMIDPPLVSRKLRALTERFSNLFMPGEIPPELLGAVPLDEADRRHVEKLKAYVRVLAEYEPQPYDRNVELIWTAEWKKDDPKDPTRGWNQYVRGWEQQRVPGNHLECVTKHVDVLAAAVKQAIRRAQPAATAAVSRSR